YDVMDGALPRREWIAGDVYSVDNIAPYPWALYRERKGLDPVRHPAFARWRNVVGARAAVQRAHRRMDEAFTAVSTKTRREATTEDLDRFFGRSQDMPSADFTSVTR